MYGNSVRLAKQKFHSRRGSQEHRSLSLPLAPCQRVSFPGGNFSFRIHHTSPSYLLPRLCSEWVKLRGRGYLLLLRIHLCNRGSVFDMKSLRFYSCSELLIRVPTLGEAVQKELRLLPLSTQVSIPRSRVSPQEKHAMVHTLRVLAQKCYMEREASNKIHSC